MSVEKPGAVEPLCVDLDGTLVATDTLYEGLLALLRQSPLDLVSAGWCLLEGKAHFKRRVAEAAQLDPATLPYSPELLDYLKSEKAAGRRLYLATGADESTARAVAGHLGLFDGVFASDGRVNLTGASKKQKLDETLGAGLYVYAGNAAADLPVWRGAKSAVVVNSGAREEKELRESGVPVERVFGRREGFWAVLLRAIRMHQWVKNLLLFVPLIAAHQIFEWELVLRLIVAFFGFSLVASSIYIWNDLLDLGFDRRHPGKRNRAFASGAVSIRAGLAMAPALLVAGMLLGAWINADFLRLTFLYGMLSVAYSLVLKRIMLVDVVILAGFYVLRVLAGGAAAGILVSQWLLTLSLFFFFSLALLKRYSELLRQEELMQPGIDAEPAHSGRGYTPADATLLAILGCSSGMIAVLVVALYLYSPAVSHLYRRPEYLWFVCPFFQFWIARAWMLAGRREMHDDPVVFALKDRASYVIAALMLVIVALCA
jgi:4-hydroxybenzoate polyprenyltransferase